MTLKFLGHTSILIESGDLHLLFDPVFTEKWPFQKRKQPFQLDLELLQQVNCLALTSPHHHRFQPDSLRYFKQSTQVIVPSGSSDLVQGYFNFHLTELSPGASIDLGQNKLHAIEALHRGHRGLNYKYKLCLNYVLETPGKTYFFCSDNRYEGHYFHEIGEKFKIDVAILPIGQLGKNALKSNRNLNPKLSVQAFEDLKAKTFVPYFYGSFGESANTDDLLIELKAEMTEHGLESHLQILDDLSQGSL